MSIKHFTLGIVSIGAFALVGATGPALAAISLQPAVPASSAPTGQQIGVVAPTGSAELLSSLNGSLHRYPLPSAC